MRKVCRIFAKNLDDLRIRKECFFLLRRFPENVKSTSKDNAINF